MTSIAPQLGFDGNCREAFEFYADLLGGEVVVMNAFGGNEDHDLPPGSSPAGGDKIRFAEVAFDGGVLRGNDLPEGQFKPMQGFNISLHVDPESAKRIFAALSEGGEVTTPLSKVDWADQFGMVTDRFGVPWLVLGMRQDG